VTLTIEGFRDRVIDQARSQRHPVSCLFELTPVCNLRCHFCYVALDPYAGPYLTTAEVCRIIDIIERAGVLWLTFTGGEVFSRRDFPEIYAYAKRKGLLVTIFTNATMVNERIAAMLREDPPFSVEVSIYGADAEHYEGTTQIPGSFKRFDRGVRLLQEAGVPLLLKSPITTLNADHVPELIAYAHDRGIPFRYDTSVDARHDGGKEPTLYRISARKVKAVRQEIEELKTQQPWPLAECGVGPPPGEGTRELYTCGAGRTAFFIDALGQASHCVIDRDPSFPILARPWDDLWQAMGEWVTQPLPDEAPCSGCNLRSACHNCPARSRLATGSPYLKDTYQCDVTHEWYGLPPLAHPADNYRAAARQLGACTT
jgi:radical SAM protein with 4Fe4S-binding SPASM domain